MDEVPHAKRQQERHGPGDAEHRSLNREVTAHGLQGEGHEQGSHQAERGVRVRQVDPDVTQEGPIQEELQERPAREARPEDGRGGERVAAKPRTPPNKT